MKRVFLYSRGKGRVGLGKSRMSTDISPKRPLLPVAKSPVFSLGVLRGSAVPVIKSFRTREKRAVAWAIIYALKKETQKAKSYRELTSQVNAFIKKHPQIVNHSQTISLASVAKMHRTLVKSGLIVP